MGIQTFTVKTCDRCGQEIDDGSKSNEWGEAVVKWSGHFSGRAWDGAAGGVGFKGESLLCLPCARRFQTFMKPAASQQQEG